MQLSPQDLTQLDAKGLSKEELIKQIAIFKEGIPFVNLIKPATIGDGIQALDASTHDAYIHLYEKSNAKVIKFTPASGAATRMFKLMHQFMENVDSQESFDFLLKKDKYLSLYKFAKNMHQMGFYPLIEAYFNKTISDFSSLNYKEKAYLAFQAMLDPTQLGFADLPKGLITFHAYDGKLETAFGEHFYEAIAYACKGEKTYLHFTISEEHLEKFEETTKALQQRMRDEFQVECEVKFSFQESYTDTVAVDLNNKPFRDKEGNLFFRPGGHGSLIENLNQLEADLIFIKNIDNIPHRKLLHTNEKYKKLLAGYLLEIQAKLFGLTEELLASNGESELIERASKFAREKLRLPQEFSSKEELLSAFQKPLRVCGMVKNEGAPGGGPFWMKNAAGNTSLQIVEKSQIDLNDDEQYKMLQESSHFNPVDLVCSVKNHKGEKYDLTKFVNHKRGFITHKTVGAKEIKALEKPGLWNGGMELWNTIFVEVPSETFCPVKTIMDLGDEAHLAG